MWVIEAKPLANWSIVGRTLRRCRATVAEPRQVVVHSAGK